jgi:hypothetical protein
VADPFQVMPEIEYQTHDNTARIALVALAVILVLIGLLYMTSVKVSDQRANPDAYALEEERGGLGAFIGFVHAKHVEIRESNSGVGKSILALGSVLMAGGSLWCAIVAFGVSVGWGIAVFFTSSIGMLAFCSCHWEEAKGPDACFGAGLAFWMIGLGLL